MGALLKHWDARRVLVFTRTKHRAKRLAEQLDRRGFFTANIQGNLSQNKRQQALDGFKRGDVHVLVATDIAARGIDVSLVSHVVNYDVPDTEEAYTHRIGRTGRAEHEGDAVTFVTAEDADMIRRIERRLGTRIRREHLEGVGYDAPRPRSLDAEQRRFERGGSPNTGARAGQRGRSGSSAASSSSGRRERAPAAPVSGTRRPPAPHERGSSPAGPPRGDGGSAQRRRRGGRGRRSGAGAERG